MQTERLKNRIRFQPLFNREVIAQFDGGNITSDAGALLLKEVAQKLNLFPRLARCFDDARDPDRVEHTLEQLLAQRIYALALGYEDLNDHDKLRNDPLLATVVGKSDPTGQDRRRSRDKGCALAGKSTLNRLEHIPPSKEKQSQYHKISYCDKSLDALMTNIAVSKHKGEPDMIILDMDPTDDPIHGNQENRFFHGYYDCYCYLPFYIFWGCDPLCARLRPSNIDASLGAKEEVERIVFQIRKTWPNAWIVLRGDGDFCRETLMSWCENHQVDFVFGMSRNSRLQRRTRKALEKAKRKYLITGKSARIYRSFSWRTLKSWSRKRRVVAKAEYLPKGSNLRFVVTSLSSKKYTAKSLYEDLYCARGDMENRIKEQQLDLFADRTSSHTMRANQLRLYLATFAYILINALREWGMKETEMEKAQAGTIRLKLFKIGALIKVSVRRVWAHMSSGYAYQDLFLKIFQSLGRASPLKL